MAKMLPIK